MTQNLNRRSRLAARFGPRSRIAALAITLTASAFVTPAGAQPASPAFAPIPSSVATSAFDEAPQIDRFSVTVGGDGKGDDLLTLRVDGAPGARVEVELPGAAVPRIALPEVSRGVYAARYALGNADALRPDGTALASMRRADRLVVARLPRPYAGMDLHPAHVAAGSGRPAVDPREAAASRAEAARRRLDNGETPAQLRANALARCEVHEGDARTACEALARGEGRESGSVRAGSVLREIATRTVGAPGAPAAPAAMAVQAQAER